MLGVNLCFAVKRMLEPQAWAAFVREELDLDTVQVTFDLVEPWWPEPERGRIIRRIREAADAYGLTLHSACVGLAHYVPGGLLDPDSDARQAALGWWQRAIDVAAQLEVTAVGGPLGSMSAAQAGDPTLAQKRWDDLIGAVEELALMTDQAGLGSFLIEPTPIIREIPSNIDACARLTTDLHRRGVTNTAFILDTGHTVYEPLYGADAALRDWTSALAPSIGIIHLDNTDRRGDPHWGWPHEHGALDLPSIYRDLTAAGLADVPVMLEVFPRFEDDDAAVRTTLRNTVQQCKQALQAATP